MTQANKIKICECTEQNELLKWYPQQSEPQRCYVELDTRTGEVTAEYNPEIGGAVPEAVWNSLRVRWPIDLLTADGANVTMHAASEALQAYQEARDNDASRADREELYLAVSEAVETADAERMVVWEADAFLSQVHPSDLVGVTVGELLEDASDNGIHAVHGLTDDLLSQVRGQVEEKDMQIDANAETEDDSPSKKILEIDDGSAE